MLWGALYCLIAACELCTAPVLWAANELCPAKPFLPANPICPANPFFAGNPLLSPANAFVPVNPFLFEVELNLLKLELNWLLLLNGVAKKFPLPPAVLAEWGGR